MLCVWWDQKGIIYYELLEPKQIVTANLYSQQLMRLSLALETKRPYRDKGKRNVILLHDNARPQCCDMSENDREPRLGSLTPPGVFTRLGSFRLLFVSVYGSLLQREKFLRLRWYQKRCRSVFFMQAG